MNAFDWVAQLLGILAALLAAPLFLGWVNQCRAWLQNRSAPPLLQQYRGIRKLFHKDAVIASDASPLFRLAPYVVFGTMVTAAAIIPSIATRLPFTRAADAIALAHYVMEEDVSGAGHRRSRERTDDRVGGNGGFDFFGFEPAVEDWICGAGEDFYGLLAVETKLAEIPGRFRELQQVPRRV